MVKKSKVNTALDKKNASKKTTPLNPFEIRHSKTKHKVIGVKEKKVGGVPGISRSRAIDKRKKTLGLEYERRLKKNKFVDERFGAQDENMTAEEKMMRRFTMERQKHHSKQNVFNLEEEELTHKGRKIEEMEEFEDIQQSDSDDEPVDNTADLHFGGFLTKKEPGEPSVHKSGKDIMEEIVAKSKMQKMERQKERGEAQEITEVLDKDWKEVHSLLAPRTNTIDTKRKKRDDYDVAVKELAFESKAKPTDRLKSEEELAKERRDKLEELERARLERMKKGTEEAVCTSADALLARRRTEKRGEKVMISYRADGTMVENREYDEALEQLKQRNEERRAAAEEEEEDDEEEESGEEEEEEEEEEGSSDESEGGDDSGEEEEEEEEELPALTMTLLEEEDGNCEFEEITEEVYPERVDMTEDGTPDPLADLSRHIADIPFVIHAPDHSKDFLQLIANQTDDVVITVIKRIIASNHPSLKEDNKEKTATFFVILIKYLTTRLQEQTLSPAVLDSTCGALFSVAKHVSRHIYTHMFGIVNTLRDVLNKNPGKCLSRVLHRRYVIYLYLIQRIYPVTDYKHAIMSPIMISINRALTSSSVRRLSDLKVGLFLCSYILQTSKTTNRYSPELVHFLTSVVCALARKPQQYLPNFKFKPELVLEGDGGNTKPALLSINKLYDNETAKSGVLYAVLRTILQVMRNYRDFTGFAGVFEELHNGLGELDLHSHHADISDIRSTISTCYVQFSQKVMPFLRYQNIKPPSIKQYEPKFDEVFVDRKGKSGDETQKLKKLVKIEMKGAIREIRKDNKFMSGVKHRQQAAKDRVRKRKVNEIMGFLSKEQGEANDLKYKKKRGEI